MHLADGTLSESVTIMTTVGGLLAFGASVVGTRKELNPGRLPVFGASLALVFVAQVLNISTGLGYSGHLMGAALLTVFFGPWSAMSGMALILAVQALVLGDGGIGTLGANFLNMGVVAACATYGILNGLARIGVWRAAALAVAAYMSTVLAALSLSVQVGGYYEALFSTHVVIGLIEAALSVGIYCLCRSRSEVSESARLTWKPALCLTVLMFALLPFSSELPDGMERSMEHQGESP